MILLASSDEKLIARWEKGLPNPSPLSYATKYALIKHTVIKKNISIVLLDYDLVGLDGANGIAQLLDGNTDIQIVVFITKLSDQEEWALFKTGIRGCCNKKTTPEQIKIAIQAIQRGELWIRRTLTNFMLEELVEVTKEKTRIEQAIKELLENLTKREYEIAMLVGQGESNKRIASKLAITERTVKAHLTEIFRKLRISDRIKLALVMKDTISSLSQY